MLLSTYSISGNLMTLQQVLPHTQISLVLSASLLNMMRQPWKSCGNFTAPTSPCLPLLLQRDMGWAGRLCASPGRGRQVPGLKAQTPILLPAVSCVSLSSPAATSINQGLSSKC